MIPRLSFDPEPDLPEEATFRIAPVSPDGEGHRLGYFQDTWPISDVTRDLALSVLCTELHLARLVDQSARDAQEFEILASAVEYPSSEYADQDEFAHVSADLMAEVTDEFPPELEGLELGVAGLVHALAVHGCLPAASCRGHFSRPSEPRWSDRPVVFIDVDREVAEQLVPLVRDSGCGFAFDSDRPGVIVVEAPSIIESMQLAEEVLRSTAPGLSPEQRAQLAESRMGPPDPNQRALW
jgi:hypothetical protein